MNDAHVGQTHQQTNAPAAQVAVMQETTPIDLLRSAHNLLIGRYRIALSLALLLAVLGALAAFTLISPSYASTGILQVAPTSQRLAFDDDASVTPRYESFVSAQATLIASRAVIDRAIQNDALISSGWPTGTAGLEKLASSLEVKHRSGEQLITIAITARSPERAQAATTAVLSTYQEIYGERNGLSMGLQESFIDARAKQLWGKVQSLQHRIDEIVLPFGGLDAISAMHNSKVGSINKLDEKLIDLAIKQTDTELKASPNRQGIEMLARIAAGGSAQGLSPAQASIQKLIKDDSELQLRIEGLRARGFGGRHPEVRSFRDSRELLAKAVEHRQMLVTEIIESLGVPLVNPDGTLVDQSDSLARLTGELKTLRERMSTEIVTMGNTISMVQRLQGELVTAQERHSAALDQLQNLELQSEDISLGRISIAQEASFPAWTASDRRTTASAVAAFVMFFAGIGSVMLYGYYRPDISSIRDLQIMSIDAPLLGVFVNPDKRNTERDSLTAVASHELRNTLFSNAGAGGTRVFSIAGAGDNGNQTDVAANLAQSFAMAGYQTLLVDGDLIGHQLSTKNAKDHTTLGLRDLLATGDPKGTVHSTSKPRLWLMPTGTNSNVTSDTLSADDISLFVQMAKKHYDVIVIDAGSVSRNLESVLFTSQCDSAVLTIEKDESRHQLSDAIDRLNRSGAPLTGVVLTNANYDDARRSGMICEREIAESLYPDGLSRKGREAPGLSETVAGVVDTDPATNNQTAAA